MSISREEIIRIMDRAMAQENDFVDNIITTNMVLQQVEQTPPVDSTWHLRSNKPVIGKLVVFVKRCIRKLMWGYFAYLANQINHINTLQNNAIRSLAQTVEEMYKQLLEAQNTTIRQQKQLEAQQQLQLDYIQHLEQHMEAVDGWMHDAEVRIHNAEARMHAAEENAINFVNRCNELNNCITTLADKFTRTEQAGMFAPKSDMDELYPYVAFENRYRGAEENISDWQSVYLKYFKDRVFVLDIGCGRGEFLTLLKQNNVPAKGIDFSDEMIERCIEQELDVEKADMFDYLEQLADGALDGVFCSQVVEHLSTQQLLRLVQLLNKKVRIGAPVVIETINPGNIVSASNGFYMDLSHIRPVHSATMSFLMEVNGFPLQEILYLHPETEKEIPSLNLPEAAEFNEKMKNVNQVLFGARDYGLVAYRQ